VHARHLSRPKYKHVNILLFITYIKTVFDDTYFNVSGDEILAVNNKPLHGLSHREAIAVFKEIKLGEMALHIGRRVPKRTRESVKLMRSP